MALALENVITENKPVAPETPTMKYLSPTSLGMFYADREKFYYTYICQPRPPRDPQTNAMSVGSAFDAYVKSYLYKNLVGKGNPAFEFEFMFESQVEAHRRDDARKEGLETFNEYKRLGALADLMASLDGCVGEPKFETTLEGIVEHNIGAVPFLGKPDIFFITKTGARVIFDWKVNGYHSNSPPSPKAGYVGLLPGRAAHKNCLPSLHNGFRINPNCPMEQVDASWANQCSIYAWLLGEQIGEQFIVAIDQIVVNKNKTPRDFRIAQHRTVVTEGHQRALFDAAHVAWSAIQAGHIFTDLSLEESKARCETLKAVRESALRDTKFTALMG